MLLATTQEKIAKLASSLGLYIYDIEMLKEDDRPILRISITRKAPMQIADSHACAVSLSDCENLSSLISPLLDVEENIAHNYYLEISSPGLERVLKTPSHYSFSLGEYVQVKLMDKSSLEGILQNVSESGIDIVSQGKSTHIPMGNIKKTKVIFAL